MAKPRGMGCDEVGEWRWNETLVYEKVVTALESVAQRCWSVD
jgi:hypothetical protein